LFPLGSFIEKYRRSPNLGATLPHGKIYVLIVTDNTFWAIFSQNHPVTLLETGASQVSSYCR
jgi:hypothetical protein